jgi:hypothetical protein
MNKVNPIFKNPEYQARFDANGFVKVPLLSSKQVDDLVAFFDATREEHQTVESLHHTTTDTQNPDLIYRVDAKIKSVFTPELEKIMVDFKPLVGCFHIKEPGVGSDTGTHQDPTFVDESKYCSANVWVALQGIDKSNGNLFFIRGSNHAITSLRVTPEFPSYYESFSEQLPDMATHVSLKKGEAVIFNNATIHGATENLSDRIRLASTLLVSSAPAEWLLYYREKNAGPDKIEKFQLELDTFISIPKNGRPDKKAFAEYISYTFPKLTKEEFLKRVEKDDRTKRNYLARITDLFRMKNPV